MDKCSAKQSISLKVNVFDIFFELEKDCDVSGFLEATIRGGFGYTLKKLVCTTKSENCAKCILRKNCAYSFLFESSPPLNAPRLRAYRNIPRPFVIRCFQNKNLLTVRLALFGKAGGYLPYFIYTFNKLGRTGLGIQRIKYSVENVVGNNGAVVYPKGENEMGDIPEGINLKVNNGRKKNGKVMIEFVSPLVIRTNGKVMKSFEPYPFITSLLRRITNLNAFYGDNKEKEINPSIWLEAAKALNKNDNTVWKSRRRYSTRQKKHIDYSGLEGKVSLYGDTGTLMPLIKAGEITGVGKNTVFGAGAYKIL